MTLSLDEFLRRFLLHLLPRASFVSATSASLPTGDAPRYFRYASQHWAQFHRRSNQKPPSPRNHTLFGFAPRAVDRWRSSNDLPLLKSTPFSTTVGHYCRMKLCSTTTRKLCTVHRALCPASALFLTRSLLRALHHTVFNHRFSILAPTPSRAPSSASVPTAPTSTPLSRSIQFA